MMLKRKQIIYLTSINFFLIWHISKKFDWTITYFNKRQWEVVLAAVLQNCCSQKQPSRGVLRKRCSENMQQIYWRTPMPKFDLLCNFIEIAIRHGCFLTNWLHFFRTPLPKNTSARLLLCAEHFHNKQISQSLLF